MSRFSAQHRVYHIAITIDGSKEIAPFPYDVDIGFINVPGDSSLSTSFCPQSICQQRSKTGFPVPDRLMGEHKAALEKHLGQIP